MFADDLKLYKSVENSNDTHQLQEDINSLVKWCDSNLLNLNISKCKLMSFHRKVTPVEFHYRIKGIILEKVAETKDLGVTFVENMTFTKHIDICVAKANAMLGFIKRWTGDIYELNTIKILYYAYVRSQLEYAVGVWCPFYDSDIRKIENVQKKFIRFIMWKDGWSYNHELPYHLNIQRMPSYESGCITYNLTSMVNRREILMSSFVGSLLLNQIDAPAILQNINIKVPCRRLRDHQFLGLEIHRTNYGDNEPINRMSKSFNNNCHLFDFTISKEAFKRRLKQQFAPS